MYSEALRRPVPVAPDHMRRVSAARDAGWEQWGGRGFERTTPPCGCGCLFTLNKGGENNQNRVGQTATIRTLGVHKVFIFHFFIHKIIEVSICFTSQHECLAWPRTLGPCVGMSTE